MGEEEKRWVRKKRGECYLRTSLTFLGKADGDYCSEIFKARWSVTFSLISYNYCLGCQEGTQGSSS